MTGTTWQVSLLMGICSEPWKDQGLALWENQAVGTCSCVASCHPGSSAVALRSLRAGYCGQPLLWRSP